MIYYKISMSNDSKRIPKLINASELRKSSPIAIAIQKEVVAILSRIKFQIAEAAGEQKTSIRYEMDSTLMNIPCNDIHKCQKLVFGRVIKQIKREQYDVRFRYNINECYLLISWKAPADALELEELDNLIKSVQI